MRIWNIQDGREVAKISGLPGKVSAVALSPDTHTLAVAIGDPHTVLVFVPFGMIDEYGKTETLRFEIVGRECVDGRDCIKVAVKASGSNAVALTLYLAQDLKGLAVRLEASGVQDRPVGRQNAFAGSRPALFGESSDRSEDSSTSSDDFSTSSEWFFTSSEPFRMRFA